MLQYIRSIGISDSHLEFIALVSGINAPLNIKLFVQVNALLLNIRDEVREYREKFQPVFRP